MLSLHVLEHRISLLMVQPRDRFWWTLILIGVLSVASGLLQLFPSEFVLRCISTDVTPASKYLLSVIGMLSALFGALFLFAILDETPQHVAVLWTGVQKFGMSAAVGFGVQQKIFSASLLVFAMFELVSGVMIIAFWFWIKQQANESRR